MQVCEVSGLRPVKQPFARDVCESQRNDTVGKCLSQYAGGPTNIIQMNHEESGTCDTGNDGYVCGECGENFNEESEVKSHMFAKHMCKCALNFISSTLATLVGLLVVSSLTELIVT